MEDFADAPTASYEQQHLERTAIQSILRELGIAADVLPAALTFFESTACGKNLEALRREFHRRSLGKCVLLTQCAKPQQEYFKACLEGATTPIRIL